MRCCKHYTPSTQDMNRHDGLKMSDTYKFDKTLPHPACTNKNITGNQPFSGCPFARNQDQCGFYEPEDVKIVKGVKVSRAGHEDVELRIELARVTFGIVEMYIVLVQGDEREVRHTVNAHEDGDKSHLRALELFSQELELLGEDKTVDKLDIGQESDEFSYLLEVTDAVRTEA